MNGNSEPRLELALLSTGGIYVFVAIRGPGLLAYVLPTADGGTELVHLAGDHQDRLVLSGDGADYVIEDIGGAARSSIGQMEHPRAGIPTEADVRSAQEWLDSDEGVAALKKIHSGPGENPDER